MEKYIEKIPQPKAHPILGNLKDLDFQAPVQSMVRLAEQYDGIFRFILPPGPSVFIFSQELVNEVCDEKRFGKMVYRPLEILRDLVGDGLFTAHTHESNWQIAHRILMPAFGPAAIRNMFPQMLDISEQMMLKLERMGSQNEVDVSDVMTRLTLDTIALCAFNYRFNSFYQEQMHPFVHAMVETLLEANHKVARIPIQDKLMVLARRKNQANIQYLRKVADELIAARKKSADRGFEDLLERMLEAEDPITGAKLSDENIRNQLITFLIAGHETTSGMLSFTIHLLLQHPEILEKAQREVDAVLGDRMPAVSDIPKLHYVECLLKESLRLYPTAPAFGLTPHEDTVIGGKYPVKQGQPIIVLVPALHKDSKVWGSDVEQFRPERFEPDAFAALPPNSWKPFGNGQRACIGRAFAMQEAILVLAMLLQRFELSLCDPDYQLKIKETLTLKPEGLKMYLKRRKRVLHHSNGQPANGTHKMAFPKEKPMYDKRIAMKVLYGSNSGSSEAFAKRIASEAQFHGFEASVGNLNHHVDKLSKEGVNIIVTASYEGKPTHDAKLFVDWLEELNDQSLNGIKYAVMGCGNRDWVQSYQAIPRKIDERLAACGAQRLIERGEADASADFFGDFEKWYEKLWPSLQEEFGQKKPEGANRELYLIEALQTDRTEILQQAILQTATILENRELVNMSHPLGRSKRHIQIQLPEDMRYRAGDYLAILPTNPTQSVQRVMKRFLRMESDLILIHKQREALTYIPTGIPISLGEVFSNYVELAQPATQKQIRFMADHCPCPPEKVKLQALATQGKYLEQVLKKRISVLDLLERFAAVDISLAQYLEMLPPLKPRQYSISSAPDYQQGQLSLTVAVVNGPAWSEQGSFEGVASNYLANSQVGDQITIATQASNNAFYLPEDPTVPVIMICAGTGLAPFRGFIQERALLHQHGSPLGAAYLFFGCDHPAVDFLYQEELMEAEELGLIQRFMAYSKIPDSQTPFVQNRLWAERKKVMALLEKGAKIYVCGDGKYMAPAVRQTFINMYQEQKQCTRQEAENWINTLQHEGVRYVTDVFS